MNRRTDCFRTNRRKDFRPGNGGTGGRRGAVSGFGETPDRKAPHAFRTLWVFLALCVFLLASAPGASFTDAPKEKKLTLMVYMCGSNLESSYGSASADLLEMAAAGPDDQEMSVLVMTGGSRSWSLGYNPEETLISEIGSKGQRMIGRLPGKNMGEKETLTEFLRYCTENRPAEEYALIFWDHGGGPLEGVCWDERNDRDHLTMTELREALSESPFGRRKLAWIGFDACLMSTVEVAGQLAPYAEYMIASQAEEPVSGWNYSFLTDLNRDRDAEETGRRIADAYLDTPQDGMPDLTMACIRLPEVAEIDRRMDAMFREIADSMTPDMFSSLAKLRFGATGFGKSPEPEPGTDGYDLVDLISLTDSFAPVSPEAAGEVRSALERAVVYSRSNLEGCCGLSVYHPYRNQQGFLERWQAEYASVSQSPGYAAYVNAYGRIMAGEHLVSWDNLDRIFRKETDEQDIICILSREQAANMASARLLILSRDEYDYTDESYFRVYSSAEAEIRENGDGETELSAVYRGESLQVIHPRYAFPVTSAVSYRISEDGTYLVDLYPHGEDRTTEEKPVIGEYVPDPETGELKLKGYTVYDEMTGTWSQRAEVDWSRYTGIYFINEYRNPTDNDAGERLDFESWQADVHADTHTAQRSHLTGTEFRLSFALDALEKKNLYAAYEITDTQGNTYMTELLPLSDGQGRVFHGETSQPAYAPGSGSYLMRSGGRLLFVFLLQNNSNQDEEYFIDHLGINHVPLWNPEEKWVWMNNMTDSGAGNRIRPGEIAAFFQDLGPEGTPAAAVPEIISGTYHARPCGDENTLTSWSFVSGEIPEIPEGPESLTEFQTIRPAADGYSMGWDATAVLQESTYQEGMGTRITLQCMVENHSDRELLCGMTLRRMNGRETEMKSVWSLNGSGAPYGTEWTHSDGTVIPAEAHGILPGETGSIILKLDQGEILEMLGPDVSLRDWEWQMTVVAKKVTGLEIFDHFPVVTRLTDPVPLDSFHQDAERLPAGKETEAAAGETGEEMEIFARDGIRLSLLRLYRMDQGKVLMLMRGDNDSGRSCMLQAEHAGINGESAKIGGSWNNLFYVRNNQARLYGLEKEVWPQESFGRLILGAGVSRYWYVTVSPEREGTGETEGVSFDTVLIYDQELTDRIFFTHTELSLPLSHTAGEKDEEEVLLKDVSAATDPIVPIDIAGRLLAEDIRWEHREEIQPATLAFSLNETKDEDGDESSPAEGTGTDGAEAMYAIFRRIRGGAGLAEMNIMNEGDMAPDREWLELLYLGMMSPAGQPGAGQGFTAVFPGIQPALRTGEEGFVLPMCVVSGDETDTYTLRPYRIRIPFLHTDSYIGEDARLRNIVIRCEPETGEAEILSCDGADTSCPGWSDMMFQTVYLLPGDADGAETAAFLQDMLGESSQEIRTRQIPLGQLQRIADRRIQLVIEPLEHPEECEVIFFCRIPGEETRYTERIPLTEFMP